MPAWPPLLAMLPAGGKLLPPTGKKMPPLPPSRSKARFSGNFRFRLASPKQIGTALADIRLDHPQKAPSGIITAGETETLGWTTAK
ncbi:hypothetical protein J3E64_003273 [Sphingobium sp. OAS761]|uniref:hypothetical protein n=1 Tax=Sphingobium sp. OAS761 TaxID=2817901 RepID=UPI0020A03FF5|nr:hypothetical protein [Sphingobium sp. OAS761]MCP1471562.1 hypothetical protein [Sphingobium sp. OAS761]